MEYLGNFFENMDKSLGLDKERNPQLDEEVSGVVDSIPEEDIAEDNTSTEELKEEVLGAEKTPEFIGFLGSKIPVFQGCTSWREVLSVLQKANFASQKEMLAMELFAMGIVVTVFAEGVSLPVKNYVGPTLIQLGYKNSKFLQKKVPEKYVDKYGKVDLEEMLKKKVGK